MNVAGHDAHLVPTDSSNLAWQAVDEIRKLWSERAGVPLEETMDADIHITKGVPVAGGMAGGSADAAAALVAAREFYFGRHPRPQATRNHRGGASIPAPTDVELRTMGASLGADIPFCLLGGTALGTGKGEELLSVMSKGSFHWAIATDKRGLSTPKVFQHLDLQRANADRLARRAGDPSGLQRALMHGDPEELAPLLVNDLQAPAISLMPSLRETMAAAKEAGALASIVSGSGPTIAMLCADAEQAIDVATAVSVAGKASATTTTSTPASGARVVK